MGLLGGSTAQRTDSLVLPRRRLATHSGFTEACLYFYFLLSDREHEPNREPVGIGLHYVSGEVCPDPVRALHLQLARPARSCHENRHRPLQSGDTLSEWASHYLFGLEQ
jgi:hypothetical protein